VEAVSMADMSALATTASFAAISANGANPKISESDSDLGIGPVCAYREAIEGFHWYLLEQF
jgi:hypothetical protein